MLHFLSPRPRMRWRPGLIGLALLSLAGLSSADSIRGNGIQLHFQKNDRTRGLYLTRIEQDSGVGYDLEATDPWQLRFIPKGASPLWAEILTLRPSDPDVRYTFSLDRGKDRFDATWRVTESPVGRFDVVTHALIRDGAVTFTLDVTPASGFAHAIYESHYPRLRVRSRKSSGTSTAQERLVVPNVGGYLRVDPARTLPLGPDGAQLSHPGTLSMQWFAYYDRAEGKQGPYLFFGTQDSGGHLKRFHLFRSNPPAGTAGLLGLELRIPPADHLTQDRFTSPTPAILTVRTGDWYDAAQFYRGWAVQQPWASGAGRGPMRSNSAFSEVVKESRMIGWFSLDTDDPLLQQDPCPAPLNESVLEQFASWLPALDDQELLFGIQPGQLLSLIYGWHGSRFDADRGAWFPAWEEFLLAARDVSWSGRPFVPYFIVNTFTDLDPHGSCLPPPVPGFEGQCVEDFAVLDSAFAALMGGDCPSNPDAGKPTFELCTHTTFAPEYALWAVEQLAEQLRGVQAETGLQGLYLDTLTHLDSLLCYSDHPSHQGHPRGGGRYFLQGKLDIVDRVKSARRSAGDPEFFVFSEAVDEHFLGRVEIMNVNATFEDTSRSSDHRELVPLFQTVYHDYLVATRFDVFQLPAWQLALTPDSTLRDFRRYYAAHLFFGQTPWGGGILSSTQLQNNLSDPRFFQVAKMVAGAMELLKHDAVRSFTRFGTRLRDPQVGNVQRVDSSTSKRLTPYGPIQPAVYVSAWRDPAADGGANVGWLLQNWVEGGELVDVQGQSVRGTQSISLTIDMAELGLPPGHYALSEVGPYGNEAVHVVTYLDSSIHKLPVQVGPLDTRFFILRAVQPQ